MSHALETDPRGAAHGAAAAVDGRRDGARRAARPGDRRRGRGGRRTTRRAAARAVADAVRRPGLPPVGRVRRLARARPARWLHLRRLAAPGRVDRGGPRPSRDFTVNAMARAARRRRARSTRTAAAPTSRRGVLRVLGAGAYESDPLRPLRLVRLAAELGLAPDAETERLTRAAAPRGARGVAGAGLRRAAPAGGGRRRARRAGAGRPAGSAPRRCCPSSAACTAWSRATSTTSTSTATRSRCCASRSSWRADLEERVRRRRRPRLRAVLDEPLGRRADPRAGAALRRAAPRHRQAGHARRARRRARDVHRARRAGRGDGPRALPAAAHQRAPGAFLGGPHPPPPRARLPRARAAAARDGRSTATSSAPSRWRSR